MSELQEPTPRQVLYALVAAGFFAVVAVLVLGAAMAGISPIWWTSVTALSVVMGVGWSIMNWRRTAAVLILSMGLLLVWTVGTLIVS